MFKILEAHVRGTTIINPYVKEENRGKFLGMADPWMLEYYKDLGITHIQMMPVFASKGTAWGYDPISWFELNSKYGTLDEFKLMLKKLNNNGIQVVLDVVYTHVHGEHVMDGIVYSKNDYTGCGGCVDIKASIETVMKSISYWFDDVGIHGMRFDLANILGREHDSGFNQNAEFFKRMEKYKNKVLISESYDIWQYSLGRFPSHWLELNCKFKDIVRAGHEYWGCELPDHRAVNYITVHDGFCLQDATSYNRRHNEINGWNNTDGTNPDYSFNHGWEGETADPTILAKREEHQKWLVKQLLTSKGHKLILAGDPVGNTKYGNNNSYLHDCEVDWIKWDKYEEYRKKTDWFWVR